MLENIYRDHTSISCYTQDTNGIYLSINPATIKLFDIKDPGDLIGSTAKMLRGQGDFPNEWMANDTRILKNKMAEILFESGICGGKVQWFRSMKTPILGTTGQAIGLLGVSVPISDMSRVPLTKQQTACLKQLALGLSYKAIGKELGLSEKTVEHYLEAVKLKLNCRTRAELIMQAIERGLVGIF